jgi:hypothetical protein
MPFIRDTKRTRARVPHRNSASGSPGKLAAKTKAVLNALASWLTAELVLSFVSPDLAMNAVGFSEARLLI